MVLNMSLYLDIQFISSDMYDISNSFILVFYMHIGILLLFLEAIKGFTSIGFVHLGILLLLETILILILIQ